MKSSMLQLRFSEFQEMGKKKGGKKRRKKKKPGTEVSHQNVIITKFEDTTTNHKVKSYTAD